MPFVYPLSWDGFNFQPKISDNHKHENSTCEIWWSGDIQPKAGEGMLQTITGRCAQVSKPLLHPHPRL